MNKEKENKTTQRNIRHIPPTIIAEKPIKRVFSYNRRKKQMNLLAVNKK